MEDVAETVSAENDSQPSWYVRPAHTYDTVWHPQSHAHRQLVWYTVWQSYTATGQLTHAQDRVVAAWKSLSPVLSENVLLSLESDNGTTYCHLILIDPFL